MNDKQLLPEGIKVSAEDRAKTPPNVLKLLTYLLSEQYPGNHGAALSKELDTHRRCIWQKKTRHW